MNPLKVLIGISLFLCMTYLVGCDGEPASADPDLLIGHWAIQEALRSDKPTESLSELYYEFRKDGSMKTNLTGATENGNYVLEGKKLAVTNTKMDATYQIETLNDSSLVMTTVLRQLNFKFTLNRVIEEE